MNFLYKKCVFLVIYVLNKCSLAYALDGNGEIFVRDGNIDFQPRHGKNIIIRTKGKSYVNINDINILEVLTKSPKSDADRIREEALEAKETLEMIDSKIRFMKNQIYNNGSGLLTRIDFLENSTFSLRQLTAYRRLRLRYRNVNARLQRINELLTQNHCKKTPCDNGGICIELYTTFSCLCPKEWQGKTCSEDVNECFLYSGTDLGCQNDAQCVNTPGSYSCICKSGWHGIHCTQKKIDCATTLPSEICGHGVCVNDNSPNGYTCICDQGWQNNGITPECNVDIDECAGKHPKCESTCQNLPGSYRCSACPEGFTGNGFRCRDIDECAVNNGGCSTIPHVNCYNTRGSYFCGECPHGWEGDGKICNELPARKCATEKDYCHPLATCREVENLIYCVCPSGMTGLGIGSNGCSEIITTPCSSNPCMNGGECLVNGTSYLCSCNFGYYGTNCEYSFICQSNPCLNGGTCTSNEPFHYFCTCPTSYTGSRCETLKSRCGGVLRSSAGILKYPPTSSYNHNTRCAWIIRTNSSKVLNVTFIKFDLEDPSMGADCQYDWLQIHDGSTPAAHLIGRFCGKQLPKNGNIITSRNDIYLWFRSDNSTNGDGFELTWTSTEPQCGGELDSEKKSGVVKSPGSPGNYPKNRDCTWHIKARPGKRIQLHFFMVHLENHDTCNNDILEVYEGHVIEGTPILQYCNTTIPTPPPFTTPSNEILIHFVSDNEGTDEGFQINYLIVEGIPGCGGVFTEKIGEFGSPTGEDDRHLNNMYCEYVIKIPGESHIKLEFIKFDIEDTGECTFDYIQLFDKINGEDFLVNKYCGSQIPKPYTSISNTLLLRFVSDHTIRGHGFRVKYSIVCGGKFESETGIITSPKYPNNYDENLDCFYEIEAPIGKVIHLEFQDFQLEYDDEEACTTDYIEFITVEEKILNRVCNNKLPPSITTNHNYLKLHFVTDSTISKKGFKANYTFIDVECGGVVRNESVIIKPPMDEDDPNIYKHSLSCSWIIIAPENYSVQLTFLNFDIEEDSSCTYDFIEIIDYSVKSVNEKNGEESVVFGPYCGRTPPPIVTSVGNSLTLKFNSDTTNAVGGFSAALRFIDTKSACGGRFMAISGTIQSPGWPLNYLNDKECEWIINVPERRQLELNVIAFHLEDSELCRYDYLEIRNGGSKTSPLFGRFCGRTIPSKIRSHTHQLYVKFVSDSSTTYKGFQIEWTGSLSSCGGILNSYKGSIISPNYPNPYYHNAFCEWTIHISKGSRVYITIDDINLETQINCDYDFLEIYDGESVYAPRLGRICELDNQPINFETQGNIAYLRLETDHSNGGKGFSLNYRTNCKVDLTQTYGIIESPNYPENYPEFSDCLWKIKAPKGNIIMVEFLHLDVEENMIGQENYECNFDYVTIADFIGGYNHNSRKYCQKRPQPFNSTSNELHIGFISDFSTSGTGFRLEYKIEGCVDIFTQKEGTFSTPNYPKLYKNNLECEWKILADYGQRVELTIKSWDIEESENCKNDGIIIANGQNDTHLISKLCTRNGDTSKVYLSEGHEMIVKFYSNSDKQGKGFDASYKIVESKCGGILHESTGFIYSPHYPQNYDSNLECLWLIKLDEHKTFNLTIQEFDIEQTNDCTGDYVEIYDGDKIDSTLLRMKACGNEIPETNVLRSQGNQMLIAFFTDDTIELKGFKFSYKENCGERRIITSDGSISLKQTDSKICIWTIISKDPTKHVTFTTTHFEEKIPISIADSNECLSSGAVIYEGISTNSTVKRKICSHHPPAITSTGDALTIKISTDIIAAFEGIYSLDDNACGGKYSSLKGRFSTPSYPDSYVNNIQCEWIIEVTDGNSIQLNFDAFNIEDSDECKKDYLEIREGSVSGQILGVYCGNQLPNPVFAQKRMWIKFNSDSDGMSLGFHAQYNYAPHSEITGTNGTITSPRYPSEVPMTSGYSWRITTSRGYVIRLSFVDLPENLYHYVHIFNGYDTSSLKINPDPENPTVFSSTNTVYIKSFRGPFMIEWSNIPRNSSTNKEIVGCPKDKLISINQTSVLIQSPGFPRGYDSMLSCSWIIKSEDKTKHPEFELMIVDLEKGFSCYADYVLISKSNDMIEWEELNKVCESESNVQYTYEGQYLKIEFVSDSSVNGTGFSGIARTKCGGNIINEQHGTIDSSQFTGNYYNCTWNIIVRPGAQIMFSFTHISIQKFNEMCYNYIAIRNGDDEDSPFLGIGKYCGSTAPHIPITFSNRAFIKWIKKSRTSDSWILKFSEVRKSCGLTETLTDENKWIEIASPVPPNPHSECVWIVSVQPGKRIHIEFNEKFDLTEDDNCEKEYVEIRDGATKYAKLIKKICGTSSNSIYTTDNTVRIKYFTDVITPKMGFSANITIATCGGTYYEDSGEITSTHYPNPGGYPRSTICEYRIQRPPGKQINITFTDINIYCDGETYEQDDRITVYSISQNEDGDDVEEPESLGLCYDPVLPYNLTILSNRVLIRFKTSKEGINLYRGFKLLYKSSQSVETNCGNDYYEAESGDITWPATGTSHRRVPCFWKIKVPKGRRIKVVVSNFMAHRMVSSVKTYFLSRVVFYNDFRLLTKITQITDTSGYTEPIYSTDNIMEIYSTAKQIKLHFSSEEATICRGSLSEQSGVLDTPTNDSITYYCEYDAFAAENETLTLKLTNLILYNISSSFYSCSFRAPFFLKTTEERSLIAFCENRTEFMISSPLPDLKIRLVQSQLYKIDSFHLTYSRYRCGGVITVTKQLIITQLDIGLGNTDCAWQIMRKDDSLNLFVSLKFHLKLSCDREYFKIYRGILPNTPVLGNSKICGHLTFNTSLPSGLYIEYHTDHQSTDSKFNITMNYEEFCGGHLMSPFPDIRLRDTYTDNMECVWILSVPSGFTIELEFYDRFFIEPSTNCSNDYLQIDDSHEHKFKTVAKLCGRELPKKFKSREQSIRLISRTNDKIHGDGFSLHINSICGGVFYVTKSNKLLASPNYPKEYSSSLDCNYTLIAEDKNNKMINIRVIKFDIEFSRNCRFDSLTVCSKSNEWDDESCKTYCKSDSFKEVRGYETIKIFFKTDSASQGKGFLLFYTIDDCGGNVTETPYEINSPLKLTDSTYINNMNCVWNITAPIGKKIAIKFELLEMEYTSRCHYDYVEVYRGLQMTADDRLGRFCGNLTGELPIIVISQSQGIIHSHTDSENSFRGFRAIINFINDCDQKIQLPSTTSQLVFTKYSQQYENNLDCQIVFTTDPGYHIRAVFESFHLSECQHLNGSLVNGHLCDYLEIRDGSGAFSDLIGQYTGHELPPNIMSTKSSLFIRFITDAVTTSSGFNVTLYPIETVCGQTEYHLKTNMTIHLESKSSNGLYLPNMRCEWTISAASNILNIHIDFEKLDLQDANKNGECATDLLQIITFDSDHVIQEGLGSDLIYSGERGKHMTHEAVIAWSDVNSHIFCGTGIPSDFYTNTNKVKIRFKTDDQIEKSGFKLKLSPVLGCFKNYTSTQGRIHFTMIQSTYCKFQINVPTNYTITLYYDLSTTYDVDPECKQKFIKVIDVKTNKTLQKNCNDISPETSLFTNSSQLEVEIQYPDNSWATYDITYLATNEGIGCGGNLYNFQGIFTSPLYPINDRTNSDCRWNIRVSNNKNVLLYFEVFDLGSKITCSSDYLEIIEKTDDGTDTVVRRYCGEDEPKVYRSEKNSVSVRFRKTVNYDGTGWVIKFRQISRDEQLPK